MAAKHELPSLGVSEISIDPVRTTELEGAMQAALERRQVALTGLENACALLGGHQEPTTRALQSRAAYLFGAPR